MLNRFFLLIAVLAFLVNGWSQEINHNHNVHYSFIENKGQWPSSVLFKSHFQGGNLWIQQQKFIFHLQDFSNMQKNHASFKGPFLDPIVNQTLIHMNFEGSNRVSNIEKRLPTAHSFNYFIGNDVQKWASDVHGFQEAVLHEFYDGIDLHLIEDDEQLKYEFHVQPGIDPSVIRFSYAGHKNVSISSSGELIVGTELGNIVEKAPYVYQIVNAKIVAVQADFFIENEKVGFKLGDFIKDVELIIDPQLIFATYAGSVTDNFGMTATYGYDGTAYSGGTIYGNAYPTPDNVAYDVNSNFTLVNNGSGSPFDPNTGYGVTDVFVSKYSEDGTTMLWTTFLGGGDNQQGTETVHSMICDQQNNVYIYGATSSTDFPVQGGFQSTHAGGLPLMNFYQNGVFYKAQGTDIYVAKISANGHNLMGSTYIGGSSNDGINSKLPTGAAFFYDTFSYYDSLTPNYGDTFRGEIMLDQNGNCLVASSTRSVNFPTINAIQPALGGQQDGVIFKLSPDLSTLLWSTYYGGSKNDACYSVKIDSSFNVVIGGGTCSSNLSFTSGGWQPAFNGGVTDGFILKLNPSGSAVLQATYVGTSSSDQVFFVEIDRNDNIFALGLSNGGTFPVINASYSNPNSGQFIAKFNPGLTAPLNATVFGNSTFSSNISPAAFLVDICGNVYVSGWGAHILQGAVQLNGMPITPGAFQTAPPDGYDFYLFVLKRDFSDILYGSYLGGNIAHEHVDGGTSRFDKNGIVYQSVCGGCGGHSDFPTSTGAWSNVNLSPNCNNIVFKFDFQLIPNAEFVADQTLGCASFTVTLDNSSSASDAYLWDFGNGDTTSVIFNPTITYDTPGIYEVNLYVTDSVCLLTDTAQITITVTDAVQLDVTPDAELCSPVPMTFTANSFGTATYFVWSSNASYTDTLNASTADSVLTITPSGSTTYYVLVGNPGCSQIDSVHVEFVSSALVLSANDSICVGEEAIVTATNLNPSISFTYDWNPDSLIVNPTSSNVVSVVPSVTQYIYVTANASNGCVIEDSILISVSSISDGLVNAYATETLVPQGGNTTLIGSPAGYTYQWLPAQGLSQPNSSTTEATVDATTIFTFSVSDGICTKIDTVLVKVYDFICGEGYIYIPNAFSPNGDNENDVLYVRGELIASMVFRIFDRWGEMVFESRERNIGWDGTFRGKKLDPDVYDYYLEAECIDGENSIIKGNVTLLK